MSPFYRQLSRRSRLAGLTSLLVVAALSGGCAPDDGGPSCVDRLCDPGAFATTCFGNSLQKCASDGLSYTFTACNSQERCDASATPAKCSVRVCTTPGVSTCLNAVERETCSIDGGARIPETCATGTACRDGECVPNDCTTGADICTTNGFLTCAQGAWKSTTCVTGQTCVMNAGKPSCVPKRCTPLAARCQDRQVYTCDALGAVETVTPCADGEVCLGGLCQPPVCGVTPTTDVLSGEVAEGNAEIRFSINGSVRVLDLNAQALYTESGRRFLISATRNSRRIEIRLAPTSLLITGAWDSDIFNSTLATICYTDGATGAGVGDCDAPFTHREGPYKVQIKRNDGIGGRVEGTFEVTMTDINRDTLVLSGGSFSVNHR